MTPKSAERPRISSVQDFKKARKKGRGVELVVPSGNTCLVQRRTMQTYISMGLIPSSLTRLVMEKIEENMTKGDDPDTVAITARSIGQDLTPEQVAESFIMIDQIVMDSVIEPAVHPAPASEDERDDEMLYIDEVDYDDKVFIYQFAVGGTSDLEAFRRQLAESVGDSDNGSGVEHKAKRAPKNRR